MNEERSEQEMLKVRLNPVAGKKCGGRYNSKRLRILGVVLVWVSTSTHQHALRGPENRGRTRENLRSNYGGNRATGETVDVGYGRDQTAEPDNAGRPLRRTH